MHTDTPVIGIGFSAISARPRIRLITRVAELAAGVAFVLVTLPAHASKYAPGVTAAAICGLAWLAWILSGESRRRTFIALFVLSAAGGVSAAAHTTGLLFVFVATGATAFLSTLPVAVGALVIAFAGCLATNLAAGSSAGHVSSLAAIGLLGIVLGIGRRQLVERGREATLVATAEHRAALADREAQLTSERNRLGREIHDVVAHTLGAVSIQLTALDSRIGEGDPPEVLRTRVTGLRGLVGDGLLELRDAVHTLRDDNLTLDTQISRLCTLHSAELEVHGESRPLAAGQALALYRVVQEALTNAAKHAAAAPVAVTLGYGAVEVTVVIENGSGSGPGPLAGTGGGSGIAGMRARVALAGGRCTAGPHHGGWRVTATLPDHRPDGV